MANPGEGDLEDALDQISDFYGEAEDYEDDMIENGVSGYQVPQQNIPALAVAIEKSLANKPTGARKAFEHWNNYNTMFTAFKKAITLVMRK